MIIALAGKKGAGKDTAAEGLIDRHKFVRIALADKLKDICSSVFEINRKDMDDPVLKEQEFKRPITVETKHIYKLFTILEEDGFVVTEDNFRTVCDIFCNIQVKSIRSLLQIVGTDICRKYVSDDIWLTYFQKKACDISNPIVVTDARFPNERNFLKSIGATLILIKRIGITNTDSHVSENLIGEDSEYDVLINNSSDKITLQSDIAMWYTLMKDKL